MANYIKSLYCIRCHKLSVNKTNDYTITDTLKRIQNLHSQMELKQVGECL